MTQNRLYDLVNNLDGDVSIEPGTNLSGSTASNGDAIDCLSQEGPVHGFFSSASATGTPDSYTVTCKLQESADGSTGWADINGQSTLVLNGDKQQGFVRAANRSQRYVRCVATPAFVAGTSPAVDVGANVLGSKRSY